MDAPLSISEVANRAALALGINGAAIMASLSEIEAWLRIASLLTAVTYTSILIVKALRKPRPKTK